MSKACDYYITGVWKDKDKRITDVLLHPVTETGFKAGKKNSRTSVVALIEQGNAIRTIVWNYSTAKWDVGAIVDVELVGSMKYLRTHPDSTTENNIDNLISMLAIV